MVTQRNMPALIAQAREVTHDTRAVNYIDGAHIVPNNLRWIAMNHNGEIVGFDFEPKGILAHTNQVTICMPLHDRMGCFHAI